MSTYDDMMNSMGAGNNASTVQPANPATPTPATGGSSYDQMMSSMTGNSVPASSVASTALKSTPTMPVDYNGNKTSLDTKDLGNAFSIGNNIGAVGHTLTGLIGLGSDILGGGVNLIKNIVTGNGDAIAQQGKNLGNNVGNIASGLLNEGAGAIESGISTLGGGDFVNSIDPNAQDRVNVLKHRLSTDGILGVAMDLYPFTEGVGLAGKLGKVRDAISTGAKTDALAEAGEAGTTPASSAITDNLKNIADPSTPVGNMFQKFTDSIMNNPVVNTAKGIAGAVGKVAGVATDFAKGEVGARDLNTTDGMKAGTDLVGKDGVNTALSNVIKGADTSSMVSKTLAGFHDNIEGALQDSGKSYEGLANGKPAKLNNPVTIEHTDGKNVVNVDKTTEGNPLLKSLQDNHGLKAKIDLNENGVPEITGFSKLHGRTGLSDSDISQLAGSLNKAGILNDNFTPSQFVDARKAIGDVAFGSKTGALSTKLKGIRAEMNDLYRPTIDSTMKTGDNLSTIDATHQGLMNTLNDLKNSGVLKKDGTVSPSFSKKLTNLTKNGKIEDPATQTQLDSMGKSMNIEPETLRKQLVWDSFVDELKTIVSKDTKTNIIGSSLGTAGILGIATGNLSFGLPAFGSLVLTQLMKNPENFVQVLKAGQSVRGKMGAMYDYAIDNSVAKLKNGIELNPEQTQLVRRLTRDAFSKAGEIGYSTLSMMANRQSSGADKPQPTVVPPSAEQTAMSNYLMNK